MRRRSRNKGGNDDDAPSHITGDACSCGPDRIAGLAQGAEFEAWLKSAELGANQPAEENWDEIFRKAKEEGEVTIYSSSSGVNALAEDFRKFYPEIKVNAYDLGSEKTIEKVVREQQAGVYAVDVVNTAGTAQMFFDMVPNGRVVNYVPRYLVDKIPQELREPLLTHVVEATTLMYNADTYKTHRPSPTSGSSPSRTEQAVRDEEPARLVTSLALLTSIVEHADDFAAAYEKHAGKPIELSDGSENAGYEFLHRLLQNDLVIYDSARSWRRPPSEGPV